MARQYVLNFKVGKTWVTNRPKTSGSNSGLEICFADIESLRMFVPDAYRTTLITAMSYCNDVSASHFGPAGLEIC